MVLKVIIDILQCLLFIFSSYYFVISLFSLTIINKKRKSDVQHSYALLIAAHNEENVVSDLIKSLKNLNYPKDLYEIFVVADNCDDNTANVSREAGATVLERFDTTKRGKGFALEFAFEKIFALENEYEYICVFDADNLVKDDFLIHMNNKINEGYRAVQGYLDSKNPIDSWMTLSYSLWYWTNNRLGQLSRENLGMGCRLGGTGFAVESELIKQFGWGATCLAEDAEFTIKLAMNDIKVGWAHKAVIYDEKPAEFSTSIKQRRRWMQGLIDLASHYMGPLLKAGFKDRSSTAFHMLMNFGGDSVCPILSTYFAVIWALTIILPESTVLFELFCGLWAMPWMFALLTVLVFGNIFFFVAALYIDKHLNMHVVKNIWGFVVYMVSWIPVGIMGFIKKNDKEWFHTPHRSKEKR